MIDKIDFEFREEFKGFFAKNIAGHLTIIAGSFIFYPGGSRRTHRAPDSVLWWNSFQRFTFLFVFLMKSSRVPLVSTFGSWISLLIDKIDFELSAGSCSGCQRILPPTLLDCALNPQGLDLSRRLMRSTRGKAYPKKVAKLLIGNFISHILW